MPIECFFSDEEGRIGEVPITEPGETFFCLDFEAGQLNRIIGVECSFHDLGGYIHVIDDKDVLETVCPANLAETFSEATAVEWLPPNATGCLEVTDREGKAASLIMKHTLPFTQTLN